MNDARGAAARNKNTAALSATNAFQREYIFLHNDVFHGESIDVAF